ncbi:MULTISPECIES: host specificity protein J [unclassified Moraxella]|uniref:host specificity protein J n=2 Tax=Moraxella TaxID=475 RepID=UPI002B40BD47|nr:MULTISPECIES: phage tail protein [unclassified Moraxella]
MQIHGSKKGQSQPQKPHIAKDDLSSTSFYKGLYGLCEGEIFGLADGGKSIKLDGTPLINASGQPNFKGVTWDFRAGTLDQSHIAGFPAIENEQNIGVELRHDRPFTKAINNQELSAVRVRLNFNALREQKDNGDITGLSIDYAIDVQTDTGAFVEVLRQTIRGKASSGFKKSHRIDLPPAKKGWTIRIRRITPNRDSDLVADTMTIDAITDIIDAKLAYPCTALLGLTYNSKTFNNIAKLSVRLKGKLIQVPTNYDPITRQYHGLWDGQFKLAYSNNPAWVFYDLCTHKRYGLGERLAGLVDKWRLYQIGQYCDELIDDGMGGKEPRFTVNVYIQQADDAYRVLQNLASVFRGMSFWDGQNIVVDADTPKEAVYTFSRANVVGGEFSYTGTRARDRHTAVKVAWDNPDNDFKTEYEFVKDETAIATQGIRQLDINAFGCTSKGQAVRAGLWALKSEQLETRSVTFKTGLQGFIPQVGQVINIADDIFAGRAISGRIVAVNDNQITLDRTAGKVGDTLTIATADGVVSSTITAINDKIVTVNQALNVANDSIWAIVSDDLNLMQFRILSIAQNDDATFDITALQYEPQKFEAVDNGVHITQEPYSVLKATPITAPNSVSLTSSNRTVQGQALTTLTINWEQVTGATAYIVKWRKDDGNWQTLPKISGQSVDIDGVYAGKYVAQVQAVDSFDNESLATTSQLTTIKGKTGKPPRLAKLVVKGILFGMQMDWTFAKGSDDTNFTQIQVSPDGQANIATLAVFSYPTNSHTITGLQGGLTQFYRARIVDKLGNASDWTAWVSGTTSADASKVLDILSGQIGQSHLDQTLRTPIAKIGTLENAVNAVNSQLPSLNQQLANAARDINTERNRITSAIRDIGTLQTANNAKTQELANLTQTVGGHTSKVRELAVTTGDLSQKYSQLKTTTDNINSEIIAIRQTQNGTASSIDRLTSRFDNLMNSPNLLSNTQERTTTEFLIGVYPIGRTLTEGQKVIIKATTAPTQRVLIYNSSPRGVNRIGEIMANGTPHELDWVVGDGGNDNLHIYRTSPRDSTTITLSDVSLILPDNALASVVSLLSEYKQSQATQERSLSERIGQIDTAYKQADRSANASIQQLERSLTDKERALSERIGQLSTQIRQPNGQYATATALDEVKSSVRQIDGKLTSEVGKISTLQSTVNGQTTSIRNVEQSFNGVRTIKAVTVDNNGFISGYGLMSDLQNGRVTSRFGINADQIYFGGTTSAKKPFIFNTRPTTIDGVSYPAGAWFNTAHIARASITNAHIADASIDNAKIANASIDSVKIRNGSVGSLQLQDGSVTSAKIGHLAVDTLNIANEAIIVPRALNSGFKEWNGEIEDEVIFAATMNSEQAPVVINLYARVSGAKISDKYNAYSSPPRINLVATHISSGEKEWILGYGEKNPPSFNRFVMSGYMSETGGNNNGHYFNGSGTSGYFGITREINRNTLLFLPKYSGEYRFELTLTLKGNVRARLYEASMLLMAVKR